MSERPSPEKRSAYRHFTTITTRWLDNDVYGHVNNVHYYSFFDTAVSGFLVERKVVEPETSAVIGFVVETHCNFFEPLSFPEIVHAGIRVARLGGSSVRYEIGLFRPAGESAIAQGHFIHVYVSRTTRRPVALPDALKDALRPLTV